MSWLIAVAIVILLALIAYYALALGLDLLVIIGMVIGGAIKVLVAPFRHRH
jgi:hypothetical protein